MSESKNQISLHADKQPPVKATYRKPEFRSESVFETRALTCGKMHANEAQCKYNRKSS
jgi:hypothetical protein